MDLVVNDYHWFPGMSSLLHVGSACMRLSSVESLLMHMPFRLILLLLLLLYCTQQNLPLFWFPSTHTLHIYYCSFTSLFVGPIASVRLRKEIYIHTFIQLLNHHPLIQYVVYIPINLFHFLRLPFRRPSPTTWPYPSTRDLQTRFNRRRQRSWHCLRLWRPWLGSTGWQTRLVDGLEWLGGRPERQFGSFCSSGLGSRQP